LKGLNKWLKNRVKALKEQLSHSKTDFENLKIIYKNSSCKCANSSFCENFDFLQKKVHYLLKRVEKFSKGQSNFEIVLAFQSCAFGKADLDFNTNNKNKPFSNFFEKKQLLNHFNWLKLAFTA